MTLHAETAILTPIGAAQNVLLLTNSSRPSRNASLLRVAQQVTMKISIDSASLATNIARRVSTRPLNVQSARANISSSIKDWDVSIHAPEDSMATI